MDGTSFDPPTDPYDMAQSVELTTAQKSKERDGDEGGAGGKRAMHTALKAEDISCCHVVQSQKAVPCTAPRNNTRLKSGRSSEYLTDEQ